jgi:uncharacterized integral membrane protein
MQIVSRLLIATAALAAVLLAVANREWVTVSLNPLPFQVEGPLYAVLMVAGFVGVVAGGVAGWTASLKWRRVARRQRRELAALELRLKTVRDSGKRPIALPDPDRRP